MQAGRSRSVPSRYSGCSRSAAAQRPCTPLCDSLVTEVASAHKTERNFGFLYSDISTALFVTLVLLGVLIDYTAASFPVVDIGGFCARAVIVARTIGSGVARGR